MTTTTQTRTRTRPTTLAGGPSAQTVTRRGGTARKAAGPGSAQKKTTAAARSTPKPAQPARTAPKATAAARSTPKPAQPAGRRAQPAKALPARAEAAPETDLVTWQDVPMPHLKVPVVHMPNMPKPNVQSTIANARWTGRTIMSAIPQPKRLLYYGGVGALAAVGVLEWPVALAAAAGVWVATHERRAAATAATAG